MDTPQIACPTCDALYTADGKERLVCERCHTKLLSPERRAGSMVILMSLLIVGLIYGAVTLPFLTIERFWISNEATIIDTALAFEGPLLLLAMAVLCLVLILPTARLLLTLYVLAPIVVGSSALPGSATGFRWAEALRPWSMAEIFVIGCGVALVKIIAMAEVTFGPAFFMFAAAVVLIWVQDRMICRGMLWKAIDA